MTSAKTAGRAWRHNCKRCTLWTSCTLYFELHAYPNEICIPYKLYKLSIPQQINIRINHPLEWNCYTLALQWNYIFTLTSNCLELNEGASLWEWVWDAQHFIICPRQLAVVLLFVTGTHYYLQCNYYTSHSSLRILSQFEPTRFMECLLPEDAIFFIDSLLFMEPKKNTRRCV